MLRVRFIQYECLRKRQALCTTNMGRLEIGHQRQLLHMVLENPSDDMMLRVKGVVDRSMKCACYVGISTLIDILAFRIQ